METETKSETTTKVRPIPVLGIPTLVRYDLLGRLLRSIDYPVEHLVIVNNGAVAEREQVRQILANGASHLVTGWQMYEDGAIMMPTLHPDFTTKIHLIEHPNAGVAQSWNEIIKLFPAAWWMISNDDIEFAPLDLRRMAADAWSETEVVTRAPAGMLYGHAASWFAITNHGVREVGLFDENIYPAYLEDCDWSRRADLLGVTRRNVAGTGSRHGDGKLTGSCTVNSSEALAAYSSRTHQNNFAYYEAKWGGKNGAERYETPFGVPDWPVWAWRYEPDFRRVQQPTARD